MRKLTTEEFIKKAQGIHGDTYDYSNVCYVNAHTNVEIICRKHGSFMQEPSNHLKGYGCAVCSKVDSRRLPLKEFIKRSKLIHGDKYDYTHVNFVNTKTDVEIICSAHGSFMQKPEKHMVGHGCPFCAKNRKDDTHSFIKKARLVHGGFYDYSKVEYKDQHTKVCIIDTEYGEFFQQPNAHLNGEGHPLRKAEKCYATKKKNGTLNSSVPEKIVKDLLVAKFGRDDVKTQYKSDKYPYACDFYVISLDLYIELNLYVTHGGHWFDAGSKSDLDRLNVLKSRAAYRNLYERMIDVWTIKDLKKRNTAIKNQLNYVVFWDNDLTDFMEWYDGFEQSHILKQF